MLAGQIFRKRKSKTFRKKNVYPVHIMMTKNSVGYLFQSVKPYNWICKIIIVANVQKLKLSWASEKPQNLCKHKKSLIKKI